jgi:hypothetical protein
MEMYQIQPMKKEAKGKGKRLSDYNNVSRLDPCVF